MPRFSDSLESYQITLWPLNLLCFQSLAADCPRLYVRGSQTINGVCSRYYYLEGQTFIRREKCCRFYRFILFNISIHAILLFLYCLSFAPFGLPILPHEYKYPYTLSSFLFYRLRFFFCFPFFVPAFNCCALV
jgi:hypothetical protein